MYRYIAGAGLAALLVFPSSSVSAGGYLQSDGMNAGAYLHADADGNIYRDFSPDPYTGHIRRHRSLSARSYTSPYAVPDGLPVDLPAEIPQTGRQPVDGETQ